MKRIDAKANKDNPSLVDFYVDGEKVENMFCLPPVRVGKEAIETTARVVVLKKKEVSDENNSSTETRVHLQDQREQESPSDGTSEDDLPTAKRNRKKASKED